MNYIAFITSNQFDVRSCIDNRCVDGDIRTLLKVNTVYGECFSINFEHPDIAIISRERDFKGLPVFTYKRFTFFTDCVIVAPRFEGYASIAEKDFFYFLKNIKIHSRLLLEQHHAILLSGTRK